MKIYCNLPQKHIQSLLLKTCLLITIPCTSAASQEKETSQFSGERALEHIHVQVSFGPRSLGFQKAKTKTISYISEMLQPYTESIRVHSFRAEGIDGNNIFARIKGKGIQPRPTLMLGTHYDTRPVADRDRKTSKRKSPVIGANDGASGVAVLLEVARALSTDRPNINVDLLFFDLEDMGDIGVNSAPPFPTLPKISELPFSIGAAAFVESNPGYRPSGGVIVDMVCDRDLSIPKELHSIKRAPTIMSQIWKSAKLQEAKAFKNKNGTYVIDDHLPFLNAGIPVVVLIHYPFPDYWHTSNDVIENCSSDSLAQVGRVLLDFIYHFAP